MSLINYLIKGKIPKIRALRLHSKDLFSTIEEFWKIETYSSLKKEIYYKELWPSIKDKKDSHLYERKIILSEKDKHSLFSLNSENPDFIKYIARNTLCTDFKNFGVIKIERTSIP